jgi:predicted hotdog family 3-hydroxylacyl-ACP dehydratase
MTAMLGPLDSRGRVPPRQQTRVAAFLLSAHGALARHFAVALAARSEAAWQAELNGQFYREAEIVSLLFHGTSWVADFELAFLGPRWEAAWLLMPVPGVADRLQGSIIDLAALAHAVHAAIRPAALLPTDAQPQDAFVQALRKIEFESGRLIQAQILFLKSAELISVREAISAAVESRHAQVRKLWRDMLAGLGVACDEGA